MEPPSHPSLLPRFFQSIGDSLWGAGEPTSQALLDKQVAISLLLNFLEKRGVSMSKKKLTSLVAYGLVRGHFQTSDSLFDESEWRCCGDTIFDQAIDGDKTAKSVQKQWRDVINCLKKYRLEQTLAATAAARLADGLDTRGERPLEAMVTPASSLFSDLKISPGTVVPLMTLPSASTVPMLSAAPQQPVLPTSNTPTQPAAPQQPVPPTSHTPTQPAALQQPVPPTPNIPTQPAALQQPVPPTSHTPTQPAALQQPVPPTSHTPTQPAAPQQPAPPQQDVPMQPVPPQQDVPMQPVPLAQDPSLYPALPQDVPDVPAVPVQPPAPPMPAAPIPQSIPTIPAVPVQPSAPPLPAPPPYSGPFSPLPASATISPRPAQTPFATFRPAPPAAAGPSWTSATEAGPSSQAREPPPVINSDASDSSQSDADDTIDNVADDLQKLRIMPSGNAQPLAAPQATEITGKTLQLTPVGPQHRWRAVIRDALLQGDWEAAAALEGAAAFPVVAARTADGQPGATHTALDWKLLMQLKTAVSSHGLHSQPTKQLLNYIFSAYVLCPADCETVARLILTPSQFMLWERAWRDECRKVVEQPRQLGDPLLNVQADILLGKGAFSSLDAQIRHPFEWHHASMTTARTAFNMVPTEPKAPSYTAVKQGLSEDYNHFIDRLAAAVEAATELDAATRQAFFRTLAFENANNKTKQLLSILPREASVDDMLERVARMPTNQQQTFVATQMDQVLDKHTQLVMAALRSADAGNRGRRYNNPRNPCFRCGLTGHPRDNCPQAAVWCDHCQLDSHATAACKRSGNYQRSAAGSRARTQVAAPVMLSAQQPPAASGWILQQQ
ncbi:uncharacterized protein LOC135174546 [Pogoniulus pusillus]|uniref:uncharacterized protein LOC135174546 n=1 Tax=Pogoniulus pusillus TaxID=488313 RepID=UPI0030B937E1